MRWKDKGCYSRIHYSLRLFWLDKGLLEPAEQARRESRAAKGIRDKSIVNHVLIRSRYIGLSRTFYNPTDPEWTLGYRLSTTVRLCPILNSCSRRCGVRTCSTKVKFDFLAPYPWATGLHWGHYCKRWDGEVVAINLQWCKMGSLFPVTSPVHFAVSCNAGRMATYQHNLRTVELWNSPRLGTNFFIQTLQSLNKLLNSGYMQWGISVCWHETALQLELF